MAHTDEYWMQRALELAARAEAEGEVPVGAVIVKDDELISEGWNQAVQSHDPSAHAEIIAIRKAGIALNNYRLINTTLYVSLEPCCMCVGAIIHARVKRLVYGAFDPKTGAAGSAFGLLQSGKHNHRVEVDGGLLADQAKMQLQNFFRQKRKQ